MSETEQKQKQPREKDQKHSVFAFKIAALPVKWSFAFVFMVIGSLFLSIIIEWICMSLIWKDEGANHSYHMLEKEIGYLNKDFKKTVFKISPFEFARLTTSNTNHYLFERTGFKNLISELKAQNLLVNRPRLSVLVLDAYAFLAEYIQAAMNIAELIAVRVSIALLSLPAFILIAVVAIVDGMVERDLRRFGGGIERALIYHYVKPHAKPIIVISWLAYLSMPISLHPNFIFVPAAVLFGLVVFTTVSSFKKFL